MTTKSPIEKAAEEYAHDSFNPDNNWYCYTGCVEDYIAGAKKLAELLEGKAYGVNDPVTTYYGCQMIPLSVLKEIMGEKI